MKWLTHLDDYDIDDPTDIPKFSDPKVESPQFAQGFSRNFAGAAIVFVKYFGANGFITKENEDNAIP